MTTESLVARARVTTLRWGNDRAAFSFQWSEGAPVSCVSVAVDGGEEVLLHVVPVVEVLTASSGHLPASGRLAHTEVGANLRYVDHEETSHDGLRTLTVRQRYEDLEVSLVLQACDGVAAIRAAVTVTNTGASRTVLRSVSSWSSGFTVDGLGDDPLAGWERVTAVSDWLGEGRWTTEAMRGAEFVPLAAELTGSNPRGALVATSDGTWSTGHHLPTGLLTSATPAIAWMWQIEQNGAWRWEIGEDNGGAYITLAGPTDADSGWTRVLRGSDSFTTVPVVLALGTDPMSALAALTDHRRATRRVHPDNAAMPVVFNDYMNTLDGDPTTAKLLPLIEAAAGVGAEIFCIDAGWYDDSGHWWDSVGEWQPSRTRFPNGLSEVVTAIRDHGMVPGLWLEPEVVGVRSPLADSLPRDAFLQRNGERVIEHHRYHLDLRHPAARSHLDSVVDRLVRDFGIGFFKLDYNINPGPGTDLNADSVGDGLLQHNRAHLAWLDGVLDRHPALVIENCSSGAMRMDYAMLSRLAMQSTSDQQDFRKYPPIAASAPMSILPEQAASWAYPQPQMTAEEAAFALVTGLLGRFYVSGHLNEMTDVQRSQVADAIRVAKRLRPEILRSHAYWPGGLPTWDAEWVSMGLRVPTGDLVSVWSRHASTSTTLVFPHLRGIDVVVSTEFPTALPAWQPEWDATSGTLTVHAGSSSFAARTFRLTANPTG